MDTPTIAQYYRETDPAKRKELLEQAIAEEGATEENQARKEIWDARYSMKSDLGGQADGYLKFWMTIEFNRTSGNRWFSSRGARKDLMKELNQVRFVELAGRSDLYRELVGRECEHLVKCTWISARQTEVIIPFSAAL